jgi:hypothetical protein
MLYSVARIPLYVEAGFQFFHSNIYCMSPYVTVLKLSSHDDRWSSVPLVWASASDVVDHTIFHNIPQMFECKNHKSTLQYLQLNTAHQLIILLSHFMFLSFISIYSLRNNELTKNYDKHHIYCHIWIPKKHM